METYKLKDLSEYLLWLEEKNLAMKPGDKEYGLADCFQKAINRVKFGQRKLQLGDFVATNKLGEPMEKPKQHSTGEYDTIEVMEWDKAVDKVIFEGWSWKESPDCGKTLYDGEYWYADGALDDMTIEDLITSVELHLKDKPAKELGLK